MSALVVVAGQAAAALRRLDAEAADEEAALMQRKVEETDREGGAEVGFESRRACGTDTHTLVCAEIGYFTWFFLCIPTVAVVPLSDILPATNSGVRKFSFFRIVWLGLAWLHLCIDLRPPPPPTTTTT